jgi:hypothetical protein
MKECRGIAGAIFGWRFDCLWLCNCRGLAQTKKFRWAFWSGSLGGTATLVLVLLKQGSQFAAIESRSMVLGAIAFAFYTALASRLMMSGRWPVFLTECLLFSVWLGIALGLWRWILK